MNRCKNLGAALSLGLLWLVGPWPADALAQDFSRRFPDNALRGELVITTPPQVLLDGRPDQLSPGARILGTHNLLVLSGTVVGQPLVVNYTRNLQGQLQEVWILTPEERRERRATAGGYRLFSLPAWLGGPPTPPSSPGQQP